MIRPLSKSFAAPHHSRFPHYFFIFTLFITTQMAHQFTFAAVPNTAARYQFLRDESLIESFLKRGEYNTYLYGDINFSSGLKTLAGKVRTATNRELTQAQMQTNVLALLNQNLNTEKYLNVDLGFGVPLPNFKLGKIKVIPDIFLQLNLGGAFAISTDDTGINTILQSFIKFDAKLGVHALFFAEKYFAEMALYQTQRHDLWKTLTRDQIIQQGTLIRYGDLDKKTNYYFTDLKLGLRDQHKTLTLAVREWELAKKRDPGKALLVEYKPMWELQLRGHLMWGEMKLDPILGWHFRNQTFYSASDGLYLGAYVKGKNSPLYFTGLLNLNFLTLVPSLDLGFFHASYSLKAPLENPQKNLWLTAIHSLQVVFYF